MILAIKRWCEGIVVAVILCIIIESLIPNGDNKKYIKVVIGIYIMYVTLNPILNLLDYDFDITSIFSAETQKYQEVSSNLDSDIKDVYILGIEEDIKESIKQLGYNAEEVNVLVDINYENIEKIELKNIKKIKELYESKKINITPIEINNEENEIIENKENYEVLINYISENYSVEKEKILLK